MSTRSTCPLLCPSTDGDGRTGRVLHSPHLVSHGLIRQHDLDLSREIIAHKDRDCRLLHGVTTDGAWAPWVEFMLECPKRISIWTTDTVAVMRLLTHDSNVVPDFP